MELTRKPSSRVNSPPTGVAVNSSHIFWINYDGPDSVNEANLDGSNPQTLVTGQYNPLGIAVHGSYIYWAVLHAGTINRANLNGSDPKILVTGQDSPWGVAVGSYIYWTSYEGGTVSRANLNGGNPHTLVSVSGDNFEGVAVSP